MSSTKNIFQMVHCRSEYFRKKGLQHTYDIVVGPIADDGVVYQLNRYQQKLIDLKTGLYIQSPAYIYEFLKEELHK